MKIFSLGFILTFVCLSFATHLNMKTMKDFFEQLIVIIPAIMVVIFFCWESVQSILIMCKHKKQVRDDLTTNWQCLLIDGAWGSGKTTHYKKNYQYIDDKPNIYISCFSASRSELIAQIIQQQFWCKLLTLNGLLAKFMESNWQVFMPKNRVVVFDDLERLHVGNDNYLDLIGIIDYLKVTNKCKIILICNMPEIVNTDESKPNIFNAYMERIVDKFEYPDLISENDFTNNLIKNPDELTKKILSQLYIEYSSEKLTNLRIIKEIIPKISNQIIYNYSKFNETDSIVNGSIVEIKKTIKLNYLFFYDNRLFKDCVSLHTDIILKEHDEKIKELQSKLHDYHLQTNVFYLQDYKNSRDIMRLLQPDFKDFLKLDIEAHLCLDDFILHDDGMRIQGLVIQYLKKYVSRNTNNNFIDGSYSILLLYILHHTDNNEYNQLFNKILLQSELMDKDKLCPMHSDSFSLITLLRNTNINQFKKLFEIENFDEKDFLTKYYDYYRNKIISKFINSINTIDYEAIYYFGIDWFKNEYSSINYELIDEKAGISALDALYCLTNKCINLKIIQKWIDNNVSKELLIKYYSEVIHSIKSEINNKQKMYISAKVDEFVNFSSEEAINKIGKTGAYQKMELLSEKYGSFDKMRDKLFRFKQMVAQYIRNDADICIRFNEHNYNNRDIIDKLFVQRVQDSLENNTVQ